MSYTRTYRERIAVHYSGTVSYNYPSSQNGGSGTAHYSGTEYEEVDVHINVDTDPFDNSVEHCNTNVNLLTGAVVATEAAQLVSIDKKLNERAIIKENPSHLETETEPTPDVKPNTVKPEQLLRLIAAHFQETERKIGRFSETERESEKHILSQMEELKRIIVRQNPDSKVRHYHVVEWKSSKVVIAIVSISILFLASFFGNIHQFEVNSRMADNDLKYRYIKSTNGVSPENLDKLENIFHYRRDKKEIREIRTKVEEYELKLNKAAGRLERERLKDTKVKQ